MVLSTPIHDHTAVSRPKYDKDRSMQESEIFLMTMSIINQVRDSREAPSEVTEMNETAAFRLPSDFGDEVGVPVHSKSDVGRAAIEEDSYPSAAR